jgi:hypothetical protein
MFCEPNLKNRDMNEAIEKSVTYRALTAEHAAAADPAGEHGRRLPSRSIDETPKICAEIGEYCSASGLEFTALCR